MPCLFRPQAVRWSICYNNAVSFSTLGGPYLTHWDQDSFISYGCMSKVRISYISKLFSHRSRACSATDRKRTWAKSSTSGKRPFMCIVLKYELCFYPYVTYILSLGRNLHVRSACHQARDKPLSEPMVTHVPNMQHWSSFIQPCCDGTLKMTFLQFDFSFDECSLDIYFEQESQTCIVVISC